MVVVPPALCRFILVLLACSACTAFWSPGVHAAGSATGQPLTASAPAKTNDELELSLGASPGSEFRSVLRFRSKKWSGWLRKLEETDAAAATAPSYSDLVLTVKPGSGGLAAVYRWNETNDTLSLVSGNVTGKRAYKVPEAMAEAIRTAKTALSNAHFGRTADWPAANRLLPRASYYTITDVETGLRFRGQRRAGSSHADVQPLTKADSAVMKQIFGGQWSWHRRAILVDSPEGPIAASMHGMPHGGDGIPGNNFNGHFCVHFDGTVTHGSGHADPAHQAMVHKAAGKLEEYHRSLSPNQLADLFLVASSQKDAHLLDLLLNPASPDAVGMKSFWLDASIQSARRADPPEQETDPAPGRPDQHQSTLDIRVGIWRTGERSRTARYLWHFSRSGAGQAWVIDRIEPAANVQ